MFIVLRVQKQDIQDEAPMLKLVFSERVSDLEDPPFYANRGNVEAASAKVRSLLAAICTECLTLSVEQARKVFQSRLPSLRVAGAELYQHLFVYDENGSPRATGDKKGRIEYFMKKAAGSSVPLLVKCEGSTRIPWGFLYTDSAVGPVEPPPGGIGKSNILDGWDCGFWVHRFDISVRLSRQAGLGRSLSQATFNSLYALHRKHFNDVAKPEILGESRQAALAALLASPSKVVYDFQRWRTHWKEIANTDNLLYFFGHSDGGSIYLDNVPPEDQQYCLDTSSILTQFRLKREDTDTATLCFFNACNTATGNAHASFLEATHRPGFHGFIGTETEIPSHIATGYATDFLGLLQRGKSVGKAFRRMKFSDFFPWSLFYACNANPDLKIEVGKASIANATAVQIATDAGMGHTNA